MEATAAPREKRTGSQRLVMRTTPAELAAIHTIAAQRGMTASQLAREALRAQGVPLAP